MSAFPQLPPVETAMSALLACQDRLRVVQIGANDGVIADPLYSFLMRHRDRTEVLLIEPQPYLIPFLSDNYKDHPAHLVANFAVGPRGELVLHTVDEKHWADCAPAYAAGWPPYRAPTGLTSADPEHVIRWLRSFYTGPLPPEQVVTSFTTESMPLIDLVERVGFGYDIDVLQVDVEGFDDAVLYESSLERLAPMIINFEHTHLAGERYSGVCDYLIGLGYTLQSAGADTLAIKTARVACAD